MSKVGLGIGVILFILIFVSGVYYKASATEKPFYEVLVSTILSAWGWLLILAVGLSLTIISIMLYPIEPAWAKELFFTAKIGAILLAFSVILFVAQVVLPLFEIKPVEFRVCTNITAVTNPIDAGFCTIFGYTTPEKLSFYSALNLILCFLIIFSFFFWMFKDMMEGLGFPSSRSARGVISFIGAYATLRTLMATEFINFFFYGWAGIGAEFFAVFLVAMLWGGIRMPFKGAIEEEQMKKFWDIVSGRRHATLKEILTIIRDHPAPYDFLNGEGGQRLLNIIKEKYGAENIAQQIRAGLHGIEPGHRNRHRRIRKILDRIIASL